MGYLVNILPFVYFSLILLYLWKKNPFGKYGIKPYWGISIFTFKVLAGTALWFIYTYIYVERSTADNFRFFDDAKVMHNVLFEDPISYLKLLIGFDTDDPALQKYIVRMFNWDKEYNYFLYNDSRTMLRFNAVCMLFSFGNYHVHTIAMSLFSFLGCTYLFKAFYRFLEDKKHVLLLAVFCIPSVIFYSSGVLKEGVLMAGLGFFFYAILHLSSAYKRPGYWLLLVFGTLLLVIMKIYVFICLVPALMYWIGSRWVWKERPLVFFIVFNVSVFAGLYLLSITMPDKDVFYMLYKKKDDFTNVAMQYESGSFITTPELQPTPMSFLSYIPFAVYTVIMRPYIWEQGSLLVKMAGLENLLLLFCMVIPFFAWRKRTTAEKKIIYFLLMFIFYLYILIGFTTPVLGAIIRYKVPALPFLVIVCLFFTDASKLKKFTPFKDL